MNWSCYYFKHEKRPEPVEWPQNCHGEARRNEIKLWKKGFRETLLSCLTWTQQFPSYRISWIWVVYTAQWLQSWWEGFVHRLKGLLQACLLERWQLCVWVWHTGEFLAQLSHAVTALLLCPWLLCAVIWFRIHFINQHTCVLEVLFRGDFPLCSHLLGERLQPHPKVDSFFSLHQTSLVCNVSVAAEWLV